jgi:hypothetical protein
MRFIPRYDKKRCLDFMPNEEKIVAENYGYFETEKSDICLYNDLKDDDLKLYGLSLICAQAVLDCRSILSKTASIELASLGYNSLLTPSLNFMTSNQFVNEVYDAALIRKHLELAEYTDEIEIEKIDQVKIHRALRLKNTEFLVNAQMSFAAYATSIVANSSYPCLRSLRSR